MKLTAEQLTEIQAEAHLDDRTIMAIARGEIVSKVTAARFATAARNLEIVLPRGFFADDSKKPVGAE